MQTPDVTPVQIVAILGGVLDTAISFGLRLSHAQQDALLSVAALLVSLVLSDAHIRHGRSKHMGGK